jgi:hypothetical protein
MDGSPWRRGEPHLSRTASRGRFSSSRESLVVRAARLPLADALEKSIFALKLNGELLPGVHGGPVRLVTPGIYGTMHVKWLRRLVGQRLLVSRPTEMRPIPYSGP